MELSLTGDEDADGGFDTSVGGFFWPQAVREIREAAHNSNTKHRILFFKGGTSPYIEFGSIISNPNMLYAYTEKSIVPTLLS